jgi:hypothetical protein
MDGFFPMDHAPEDSDTRELMLKHMQGQGKYNQYRGKVNIVNTGAR